MPSNRSSERDAEFVDFVTAQRTALLRMARLLTAGDDASAEDLVQTTLTRLYVHWPRVRRAGNPVGYARTSLTHAFVDEQRRAYSRRETPTEQVFDSATLDGDHDLAHTVLAALATLAPRQRAVVVLRHFLDLDVAETARMLGCTTGTVKSQNAKALANLRAVLEPAITVTASNREPA
ncbi:SigE family RNA polymerase sigma factor [Nocardioides halotolerans]|jgi:RNA polymerase sigma-70 factor (sigma-E family)|uniref:SigE family RNA polymerase sigma factor n=1 Tax=Nocardioides halotolerans TaxID=433660 RepID=UPI000403590A|nr:SigE family RNA polymerase sigma factor [Nocardioides halotolerans]